MQRIFEVIRQYRMIEPGMRILAGVSGGADSVCLLYVLKEYQKEVPFELMVIHVEHGIRGEASLADAAFTQKLCEQMEVPCRVCTANVVQAARETGQSLEEAGRSQRYRIFEEMRSEWNADRIAVAHNENDQAETLLWNLVRGSGIKGLGGIRPIRDQVIRPLLYTSRTRIEEILQKAGLDWRTDSTNLELDYTRNRIRHQVLPLLEQELNPRAVQHMAQAARRLAQMQQYLDCAADQAAQRCIRQKEDETQILLEDFLKEEELVQQELLRRAVFLGAGGSLKDVGAVHIHMLEKLARMDCGKMCHLPGRIRAVRENGVICVRKEGAKDDVKDDAKDDAKVGALRKRMGHSGKEADGRALLEVQIPLPGTCQYGACQIETQLLDRASVTEQQIQEEKKYTKWLSCDTITCNVCLRTRRTGDYLVVNGQGGRKKLKDYLIDQKVPKEKRDQILLAADGSRILWVIGYRISEEAKVRPETKKVMKISLKEIEN